jgi:hypothetical protein
MTLWTLNLPHFNQCQVQGRREPPSIPKGKAVMFTLIFSNYQTSERTSTPYPRYFEALAEAYKTIEALAQEGDVIRDSIRGYNLLRQNLIIAATRVDDELDINLCR